MSFLLEDPEVGDGLGAGLSVEFLVALEARMTLRISPVSSWTKKWQ